jgi:adenylate kinase
LYQRADDQPATVEARLRQQLGALDLVVAYYRDHAVLKFVDGRRDIDAVTVDLLAAIVPAIGSMDQGR